MCLAYDLDQYGLGSVISDVLKGSNMSDAPSGPKAERLHLTANGVQAMAVS